MILFPAIDLKGGACVRLVRGEMASATVFNDDPAAQARTFADLGFRWLHVVDLDGAFAGKSVNGDAVRAIRRAVDLRMQLGGGIRDRAAIRLYESLGYRRWGTHPAYAQVDGGIVPGHYYYKRLDEPAPITTS